MVEGFLSPVFESANRGPVHHLTHTTEYLLMGSVLTLTSILIAIAYIRFVRRGGIPVGEEQVTGFGKILYHKYYVDEIYDFIIVRPLERIAKITEAVIEVLAIDRLVNSAGQFITASSQVLRRVQNGSIGFYIFVMIISIIVLLTLLL